MRGENHRAEDAAPAAFPCCRMERPAGTIGAGSETARSHGVRKRIRKGASSGRPAGEKGPSPVPCDRCRVLLVDDEASIRFLFHMILSSELGNVRIDLAADGREAVGLFREGHHAVVLMDLHMPVMDGRAAFGSIEELCRSLHWEMPSVVFCTGFACTDAVLRIVQGSPSHCLLSKPVSSEKLVNTVRERLREA